MKEKVIAFLSLLSLLAAAAKFAATQIFDALKYIAVQAHDFWAFWLNVWK